MDKADTDYMVALDAIKQRLMEAFKHISEAFGIKGIKQRILTVLFLNLGRPVSLTELARLTHFSKSSVSRASRELLMEIPLLESIKKPNNKEKYYTIDSDYVEFIAGFLAKTVHVEAEPTLEATESALKDLAKLRKKVSDSVLLEDINSFLSQMEFIDSAFKKYLWFAERLLAHMVELEEEWREGHIEE